MFLIAACLMCFLVRSLELYKIRLIAVEITSCTQMCVCVCECVCVCLRPCVCVCVFDELKPKRKKV